MILRDDPSVIRIIVHGDFDAYTAPRFKSACDEAERRVEATNDPPAVLLDLDHTTLIDSAAITSILLAARRFPSFALQASHPWQERLFAIVGLWETVERA